MVTFTPRATDDAASVALLTEYFTSRELGFTGGVYRTTYPTPELFVPPRGVFLVVSDDGLDVGCGGIRRIDPAADGGVRYEVKHLWLQPDTRGRGLGRLLLEELERRAVGFGAHELVLDTNDSLAAAGGLYRSSGFVTVEPYNDNPNATTWYAKPVG